MKKKASILVKSKNRYLFKVNEYLCNIIYFTLGFSNNHYIRVIQYIYLLSAY